MIMMMMRYPSGLVLVLLATVSFGEETSDDCRFSNHFVVEFEGSESEAKEAAAGLGFTLVVKVFEEDNLYDFLGPEIPPCSLFSNKSAVDILLSDSKVKWVEQQTFRDHIIRHVIHDKQMELVEPWQGPPANHDYLRVKKDTIPPWATRITFNDPYFKDQWYLHNEGQTGSPPGNDLNVLPAWDAGFTGRGVILSVLDDGLQHTNPDIRANYEPSVSFDLVDFQTKRHDPMPDGSSENSHGTYCAGVIAAVANNSVCGVGVAYNAKVGGIRILDGPVTDLQEALALSLALDKVDIYSASWGPQDDGRHLSGPATLASRAFRKGIEKGRKGKGAVYVWAVGNGGINRDNCNMDGYVSSIYTLAISALTDSGLSAYYTEPCASTLASTFIGGTHKMPSGSSDDIMKDMKKIKIVVPGLDGDCIESFQGTSAAAPMAAGVIALILEANPELTWRDVQHVVVEGARIPSTSERGWQVNGAGYHFHLLYGFGVMDAAFMVSLAQKWTNVGRMNEIVVEPPHSVHVILPRKYSKVVVPVVLSNNCDDCENQVNYLEYAIVRLNVRHHCRGNLEIFLTSPSGTESQILTLRPNDVTDSGINEWDFMSVHFWGENPIGNWSLGVFDYSNITRGRRKSGSLEIVSLVLLGTTTKWKMSHLFDPSRRGEAFYPDAPYLRVLAALEKRVPIIRKHGEITGENWKENNSYDHFLPSWEQLARTHFSSSLRYKRLPIIPEFQDGDVGVEASGKLAKLNELLGLIEKYIQHHE